ITLGLYSLQLGSGLVALGADCGSLGVDDLEPVARLGELEDCAKPGARTSVAFGGVEEFSNSDALGEQSFAAYSVCGEERVVAPFGLGKGTPEVRDGGIGRPTADCAFRPRLLRDRRDPVEVLVETIDERAECARIDSVFAAHERGDCSGQPGWVADRESVVAW